MFQKTLICLDGSKLAEEILPYAADHCQGFKSEAILLQVISTHITIPPPESTHVLTFGIDSKPDVIHTADIGKTTTLEPKANLELKEIEREQAEAKGYLNTIANQIQSRDLKVKTLVLHGEAVSEAILDYAKNAKVSLIALTTHGKGGLKHGAFGRVAMEILKTSEIPMLLVRSTGKA